MTGKWHSKNLRMRYVGNKRKVRMRISKQLRILKFNYDSLFQIGYFLLIFNQVLAQSQFNEMKYPSLLLQLLDGY